VWWARPQHFVIYGLWITQGAFLSLGMHFLALSATATKAYLVSYDITVFSLLAVCISTLLPRYIPCTLHSVSNAEC
jgi:hypothetical protein